MQQKNFSYKEWATQVSVGKNMAKCISRKKKKIGCDFPLQELESRFIPQGAEAVWPPWPLLETWLCHWCWLGLCFLRVLHFTCYPCLLERQSSKCSSAVMIQHTRKGFQNFTQYLEKIYFLGKTRHTGKVIIWLWFNQDWLMSPHSLNYIRSLNSSVEALQLWCWSGWC